MISSATSFMIMQTGFPQTVLVMFENIWHWYSASDIFLYTKTGYLNEVPMANFLDSYTVGEDPDVIDYQFTSNSLGEVLGD